MRVLHINCNYIGTTLHQTMVEELSRQGIENEVFVPTYDKHIAVIKPNENVCVSECFHKWDRLVFDYKQKKIIKAIEARYDIRSFDLIHAYTVFTDGNVARTLSKKYGIPYVVAVRNTDVNDFFRIMVPLRSRGVQIMKDARAVFFLSNAYKNQVFDRYIPAKDKENIALKTRMIPNGIDDFWLSNAPVLPKSGIGEKVNMIFAGRIDKNKNIPTILKAVQIMAEQGSQAHLTVVGRVQDKKEFQRIQESPLVTYKPAMPKEKLIEEYRAADIFVMPSFTESFGLVYAEAMSQGLPVIYSKGQGFDGQFPEGFVGYHVDAASPRDLAERIMQVIAEYPQLQKHTVESAKVFQWSELVTKYRIIYELICRGKK